MLSSPSVWLGSQSGKRVKRDGAVGIYSSQAAVLLETAGESADQVAETLRARGIQGVRNAVRMLNPIVRLIQPSMPPNILMHLMNQQRLCITLPDGTKEETPVPQPIVDFLDAFHAGNYPALEMALDRG